METPTTEKPRSLNCCSNSMNQGISILQGPHQVAQKSSRITLPLNDARLTSRLDVSLTVKFRFAGFASAGHDVAAAASESKCGNGRSALSVSSASASALIVAALHLNIVNMIPSPQ